MARLDGPAKVAGKTVYAADMEPAGTCYAAIVRSPFPHARITGIDASDAGLPGVIGIFTAADLPAKTYGRRVLDVPVLARDEVRFVGERVAAVVAESREVAERAAARVRVSYEALEAVLDPEEAVRPGAPSVHAEAWAYPGAVVRPEDGQNLQSVSTVRHGGDVDEALAAARWRVDRTYTTPAAHQGYIEPQNCVAAVDPDGRMYIWMANKSPYRLRAQLAAYLEVPPDRIEVRPVAIGGDFGGKGSPMDAPLCLALARICRRPVKLVLRYAEDLMATNPRHASRIRVRVACDAEGRLAGLALDALFNGGAYAGFKPRDQVDLHGVHEAGASYRIPAVRLDARIAYTHAVPGGHMRAPGAPQTNFAVESALDELAAEAGIDPVELRRRNVLRTGDANPYGVRWAETRATETLDAALAAYRPLDVPPGWRHGRGISVYDRSTGAGATSMRLRAEPGGGVTVFVPFPETGTGSHTVVQLALSEALGLPPERIAVRQLSTSDLPRDDGVGGSRVTSAISLAAEKAAAAWRARGDADEVTIELERAQGERLTSFCVEIAQVALDADSGQVRVLEILAAVDVAGIVNDTAHRIQVEGGLAMGHGFAVLEDLDLADGRVGAANLGDFKLPSVRDVPVYRVVFLSGGRGLGILNVKSIGETANVPTAAAIANAVAAAGVRVRDLPITAETVFFALHPEEVAIA